MPNKTKQNERLSSCVVKNLNFCDKRIFDSQVCSKLVFRSLPIPADDVELDEYLGWKTIFSILGRP
jgi:hypothetical protein